MFDQEKKAIVSMMSTALVLIAYCIYGYLKARYDWAVLQSDLTFWAGLMLIFIGISIVLTIIIQILFHILNSVMKHLKKEEEEAIDQEDEMDKRVSLLSTRNGYIVVGAGFVISLVTLVVEMPSAVMLNIVYLSFFVGSLFEGCSRLYLYRKGIGNG